MLPNLGAASLENIQEVVEMVTVIGQYTADSRVGSRSQCTPADYRQRSGWCLESLVHTYRLAPTGSNADSNFESAEKRRLSPTIGLVFGTHLPTNADCQSAVGAIANCRLPVGRCALSISRTMQLKAKYSRTPDERPPSPTTIPLIRPHFV